MVHRYLIMRLFVGGALPSPPGRYRYTLIEGKRLNLASLKPRQTPHQVYHCSLTWRCILSIGYTHRKKPTTREGRWLSFRAPPVRTSKSLTRNMNVQRVCPPMLAQRWFSAIIAVLKQVHYQFTIRTNRGSSCSCLLMEPKPDGKTIENNSGNPTNVVWFQYPTRTINFKGKANPLFGFNV